MDGKLHKERVRHVEIVVDSCFSSLRKVVHDSGRRVEGKIPQFALQSVWVY
jgi:hypothetical protein